MKAWLVVALLLLGHFLGLRELFALLDAADAAGRKAYTHIAPHIDHAGETLRREYQEARRGSR